MSIQKAIESADALKTQVRNALSPNVATRVIFMFSGQTVRIETFPNVDLALFACDKWRAQGAGFTAQGRTAIPARDAQAPMASALLLTL